MHGAHQPQSQHRVRRIALVAAEHAGHRAASLGVGGCPLEQIGIQSRAEPSAVVSLNTQLRSDGLNHDSTLVTGYSA